VLQVSWRSCLIPLLLGVGARCPAQQTVLTWEQVRSQFLANNPTLAATGVLVDESKAGEITAYLRPNPDLSLSVDGVQISRNFGVWRPLSGVVETPGISYLHEREHKRELRLDSAKKATGIAELSQADQERNLIFNLRNAFVQTLQAKAVLQNAEENLAYWDREISLSRDRFAAGDMAKVDLNRLELQRVQYESDRETALISLRTAKIQLLQLLNSRTPIDMLDVAGPYEFSEQVASLEEVRNIALASRPDLMSAVQAIEKAKADHLLAVSNGSADPTFSVWYSHNPSFSNPFANETMGGSINIPLRVFDRNQGEKARTQLDIGRNEKLRDASQAQVFSDVDSAYVALTGALSLLRPYKTNYLPQAESVRETVAFSYQNGAASLLDFLDAQKAYRDIRLSYLNLIGSYLTAASQLNLAAGREVIP
jgi:cobalt-zinc-cadmium efflux system outer membrane protein